MDNKKCSEINDELFNELLVLLDEFDRVCSKHNLRYYLQGGTLIGAVRHGGFIPWDDDIDLVMLREDFDKLLCLPKDTFMEPFFLQTPATDSGYCRGIARLRNSNTTMIPYRDAAFTYNHGIFLDIFVLDAVIDNPILREKQEKRISRCLKLLHFSGRVNGGVGTLGLRPCKKIIYYALYPLYKFRLFTPKKIYKKLNKIASMYEMHNTELVALPTFQLFNKRNTYFREDFDKTILVPFEGRMLPAPSNYDRVLTTCYGDYMTPVKEETQHGTAIIETKIPYKEYVARNREKLKQLFIEWVENQ